MVDNAQYADELHDYGASKRRAVIAFLEKVFDITNPPYSEDGAEVMPVDSLKVFDAVFIRPAVAVRNNMELYMLYTRLLGNID